jgi:hypothetical protein
MPDVVMILQQGPVNIYRGTSTPPRPARDVDKAEGFVGRMKAARQGL